MGGRQVKGVVRAASTDYLRGSTTAIIPNSGDVTVWAWIYLTDFQLRVLAGRGQDGSGDGWGFVFYVSDGNVVATMITVTPGNAQNTAQILPSAGSLKLHRWNFVACVMQNTYGTEPSHITAYANGGVASKVRTGLSGWSGVRASTVGFFIDDWIGAGGEFRSNTGIGAVGVLSNAGLTETQALARMYEIERVTAPYFLRSANDQIFVETAGVTTSYPPPRASRAQQHLLIR